MDTSDKLYAAALRSFGEWCTVYATCLNGRHSQYELEHLLWLVNATEKTTAQILCQYAYHLRAETKQTAERRSLIAEAMSEFRLAHTAHSGSAELKAFVKRGWCGLDPRIARYTIG